MVLDPLIPAEIAKLISASARHMLAAFDSLNHQPAFTSPVVKLARQISGTIIITAPTVSRQQALFAKRNQAHRTLHVLI